MHKRSDISILTLSFQNSEAWLLLLLFLFFFATIVIGRMLQATGSFIREKDETGSSSKSHSGLKGKRIPLIKLSNAYNRDEFEALLQTLPDASLKLLKQWLKKDFLFMAVLYPFMFLLAVWLLSHSLLSDSVGHGLGIKGLFELSPNWRSIMVWCKWLSLVIWLFDFLENTFTLRAMAQTTTANIIVMRVASVTKWLLGLLYTLPVVTMLLVEVFLRMQSLFK